MTLMSVHKGWDMKFLGVQQDKDQDMDLVHTEDDNSFEVCYLYLFLPMICSELHSQC